MSVFITEFKAIRVKDGELRVYAGDNIESISFSVAQEWCDEHKPWLKVIGKLNVEFNGDEWVDYDKQENN